MRKRYAFLLAILLLAFAAGLAWQLSQPREPIYEGKPLSYWLEGYNSNARTETSEQSADNAIREIGTNAIPTLLQMLQKNDSPLKLKFFALFEKQHFIKIRHVQAMEINYQGMKGFEILGASAKGTVPALIQLYGRKNLPDAHRFFTAGSLGAIGPAAKDAIPILLTSLASTNPVMRAGVVIALGEIHSKPELVLPALTNSLNDSGKLIKWYAAEALGRFGADAKPAVPALVKLLNDPDPRVRTVALSALKQIDPQTAASLATNLPPVQTPP